MEEPSGAHGEPIPSCPICDGPLAQVYAKLGQIVLVCPDCQSSLSVPGSAWHIRKLKKLNIWKEKPGA
jgi:uncharacterized protein YbaR (Trm112 family)